jgi:hypothetical protein
MGMIDGIASWFRKVALLVRRGRFRDELAEEMDFHRTQAQREFEAAGMTPKAARQAAARQFGNRVKLREQSQEMVGFRIETVAQDLRFALRQLRKNPSFAVTAVAILALGIGASVAIFGFVDAALIKPLPYQSPSRLAMLFESNPLGPRFHLSYLDYLDWKKRNKSFTALDIFAPDGFMLRTSEGVQRATGAAVTPGSFRRWAWFLCWDAISLRLTILLPRRARFCSVMEHGRSATAAGRTPLAKRSRWTVRPTLLLASCLALFISRRLSRLNSGRPCAAMANATRCAPATMSTV